MQDLSYNDLGRVIANNRSGDAGDIRYAYDDLHGWVSGINSGAGFEQRMYRETDGKVECWDGSQFTSPFFCGH